MQTKKIKIATLGAAVQDVFLEGNVLTAKRDVRTQDDVEQFPLGEKLELENVTFSTGGGATNAAVTFARHGFDTTLLAKIGKDPAATAITSDMQDEGVNTAMVAVDGMLTTGYSTLLLSPSGERTALVFRGASERLEADNFDLNSFDTNWLYITSLGGNMALLEAAIEWAIEKDIKVAIDPGSDELKHPEELREMLSGVTLVKGNIEEMGKLFGGKKPKDILKEAAEYTDYAIVTDGPNGSWATDSKKVYKAGMYEAVKVADRTGAGDAFGSGFVAVLASGGDIEKALTFGSANSTSVVQYVGAKKGILGANAELKEMEIEVSNLN
ncbi:MAG: carbohydrate kinase family protein [Candidatus Saccharimonadales bacterium]